VTLGWDMRRYPHLEKREMWGTRQHESPPLQSRLATFFVTPLIAHRTREKWGTRRAAWIASGGPVPRCQLKAPPSRTEREKDGAPAFGCGESMGQLGDVTTQGPSTSVGMTELVWMTELSRAGCGLMAALQTGDL
jgi:hypothetical protein